MIGGRVVVVGFSPAMANALQGSQPERSVVFVEEPDVASKRGAEVFLRDVACCAGLIRFPYQRPDAADLFHLARRADGRPLAVVPGVEYATTFAARLAERLGLPGAGLGAAELLHDKERLRRVAAAAGVANPVSRVAESPADVVALLDELGGPVVVKPSDRQAAVGVSRVHDAAGAPAAFERARRSEEGAYAPDRPHTHRVLVEEFVAGGEYSVELLVSDGEVVFSNATAKRLFPGPYPVECGHVLPLDPAEPVCAALLERTAEVVAAVALRTGIVHCEWIVRGGQPFLVECAGRVPGDGITTLLEAAWGVDVVAAYVALLRGELDPASLPRAPARCAAVAFAASPPGRVAKVEGVKEAAARPGVLTAAALVAEGAPVRPLASSWDRTAMAIAVGDAREEAEARARAAVEAIRVVTDPRG